MDKMNTPLTQTGSAPHNAGTETIHCDISVIIPVYNERESLPALFEQLLPVLRKLGKRYEVIAVNDGSIDGSLEELRRMAQMVPEVRVIDFRRNCGQTAAIMAGINLARGSVIITMDADLQNDPRDIPDLLAKMDEGFDVVSGWRCDRQDAAMRRNLPSRIANWLISATSGIYLHDYGCTLKAYRNSVLKDVRLYGEMHRFIPIYASWYGARITEIPVQHHARRFGRSNYGLNRIGKVILDLLLVMFLDRYITKPIYVFGGIGLSCIAGSFGLLVLVIYLRLFMHVPMISTPLPLLSAIVGLVGVTSILLGLVAEIVVRTYFESQDRQPYVIREIINS